METDPLGGSLPIIGMEGIVHSIKVDFIILGVGKWRRNRFPHSHAQFLAHRYELDLFEGI